MAEPALTDLRILIIDDQDANLKALEAALRMEGYAELRCLSDPREALSVYLDFQPDLVMLDLHMPHVDGVAVMDQLRSVTSDGDYVPILVLTGDSSRAAREKALSHGAKDFLSKPLNGTEVQLRVRNLLQTRSLHVKLKGQNAFLEKEVEKRTALAQKLQQSNEALENTNRMLDEEREALEESESELRHQTKLLQSVLDSMGDGVIVSDETGKIVIANPAFQEMAGPEILGAPPELWQQGLYHADQMTPFRPEELPLVRALRGEIVEGVEMFARNPANPEGILMSVKVRPLKDDDGVNRGGVAVIHDISEAKRAEAMLRKAKEEAERANQAKSEFLSRMSHELRTPLNAILGFAQLLELANLAPGQHDYVQRILKGGRHLLDLINEILDLSRIEAGRLSLSPEPVRLNDVSKDALDLVSPLALEQGIQIDARSVLESEAHVHADRQRLKQVLLNLLANAIKFNHKGGSVSLTCQEVSDNRLRIEVADTGQGIEQESLGKLFTPFERLGADRAGIGGSGLGLALSKRLVEAMGGRIGVESTVGVGSRFYFELALHDNPLTLLGRPGSEHLLAGSEGGQLVRAGSVLYIEDNISNLQLIEQVFAPFSNVKLLSAMQGLMGLSLAETHAPDWILLDLHLPDIHGEEVLQRLQSNPRTRNIPVTVLSADATPSQVNRLLASGARDYLTKPVDIRGLLNLLQKTMQEAQAAKLKEQPTGEAGS